MWGIVVWKVGIDKPVNLSQMAPSDTTKVSEQVPDRIPLEEVYMRMAEELAKRSTCARLQVGSVITTGDLTQVLGIGYNGNAKGLPNRCDSDQPGNCGCFGAGSLVMTDKGQVRIERIKVGDRVLTHKNRYRAVTELFRHQHSGAMVHLFLESRSETNLQRRKTATPEHPFLVRRAGQVDWVKAGGIQVGDEVAVIAKDCETCGKPIPHYRRLCPQCFTESSKSVAMRERHSKRMTKSNPMRGIHTYDPSRSALSQQLLQKNTTRKVYEELVGLKSRFETQGFRAIVIDHTVRPDLILVGNGQVIGVEYDTRLFPKNGNKYDDRPDVRNQYDDIIWVKRDRLTWDLHEGAFVWAAVGGTKTVDVDVPVYNIEVEEDHSYVCQSTVVHNCIHSEQNALIKAGAQLPGKVMFVSASPCVMCAKMIINTNVARVYYREAYRDPAGLNVLRQGGVEVIHYDRWRDLWR
jgi:deoxycytidylate deaminase